MFQSYFMLRRSIRITCPRMSRRLRHLVPQPPPTLLSRLLCPTPPALPCLHGPGEYRAHAGEVRVGRGAAARGAGDAPRPRQPAWDNRGARQPRRTTYGQRELDAAIDWNSQAIDPAREVDYRNGYHWALLIAAEIAAARGQHGNVVPLLGGAEALRTAYQLQIDPDMVEEVDRITAEARTPLGDEAMDALLTERRALALEEALDLARQPLADR
jgi:hypothetical protein